MAVQVAEEPVTADDLVRLAPELRRVVASRTTDPEVVDDVVQEALTRVWDAAWRLEREAAVGYGIVTARNLVTSQERATEVQGRHSPRLAEPDTLAGPEDDALRAEEHAALSEALTRLPEPDQRLLVEHEVHEVPLASVALDRGSNPGAAAAALARARARLRLEYLLAFRRVELPTRRCRTVLTAVSLGDRRRQAAVHAGPHLLDCDTCAALSDPLLHRSRALTGILLLPLLDLVRRLREWWQHHPVAAWGTAASTTAVATVATVLVVATPATPPATPPAPVEDAAAATPAASPTGEAPPSPPGPSLLVSGEVLLPAESVRPLARLAGRPVEAVQVPVLDVVADEGFWVGWSSDARVWVELDTGGAESPEQIRPGQLVSFDEGMVELHDEGFAEASATGADAEELARAGAHVSVPLRTLVVE